MKTDVEQQIFILHIFYMYDNIYLYIIDNL